MKTQYFLSASRVLIGALCMASPMIAGAGVNLKNGNFYISYLDLNQERSGHKLELSRTYNSRASEVGWMGYGWGSTFEASLTAMPDGTVAIHENGTGQWSIYRPTGQTDVAAGVERIVQAVAKKDGLSDAASTALRNKLSGDEEARITSVRKYAITSEPPVGVSLADSECPQSTVVRTPDAFERVDCIGRHDRFDLQGRLLRRTDRDGYVAHARYEGSRPMHIEDSEGQRIDLIWDSKGLLVQASSTGTTVKYQYDAGRNLVASEATDGSTYRYAYDSIHNLTRISYIDGSSLRIEYSKPEHGMVSRITERSGDLTEYAYRSDPADAQHFWTQVTTVSTEGKRSVREMEYREQTSDSGTTRLAQVGVQAGRHQVQTICDDQGRISRQTDVFGQTSEYVYHPRTGKLILHVTPQRSTQFHYNGDGELERAENTDGQQVELNYNGKRQIISITQTDVGNGVRHHLAFSYNASGKPNRISVKGTGAIDVEYDDRGEIKGVHSREGARVAMRVTQTFQTLLKMVRVGGVRM